MVMIGGISTTACGSSKLQVSFCRYNDAYLINSSSGELIKYFDKLKTDVRTRVIAFSQLILDESVEKATFTSLTGLAVNPIAGDAKLLSEFSNTCAQCEEGNGLPAAQKHIFSLNDEAHGLTLTMATNPLVRYFDLFKTNSVRCIVISYHFYLCKRHAAGLD